MVRPTRATVECLVARDAERRTWFVGDDVECAVIDPAGSLGELLSRCDSRRLSAILWTSLWPGSVGNAVALADRTGAVTYLDADDLVIWRQAEPERRPQCLVPQGLALVVGGIRLESIHTPGITPGALCWYAPALSVVFTGPTLGADGPGETNTSAADRSTLLASVRAGLFSLPTHTIVHPAQGDDTRIGTQRWDRRFWS